MTLRCLEMKISPNVLEHLGMNLYSSVPPVLFEIVANAWDADATHVNVDLNRTESSISIQDDGRGMSRDDIVDQYFSVGFRRRDVIGRHTPCFKRSPMGRKGIGKLSSFSIAKVVTVHTVKNSEKTAFRMDARQIQESIKKSEESPYQPEELSDEDWPQDLTNGTRITLTGLKKSITALTQRSLQQRLARRFSVIGPRHNFKIEVNGNTIEPSDRGYFGHVEYLWTYGDQSELLPCFKRLKDGREPVQREAEVNLGSASKPFTISGWIGTVEKPDNLKDEDNENLNRLAVFMRGKLAHEDILDGFGDKRIYADYVVGELHFDGLDRDEDEDIATTNRQSLKVDDPRFTALRKFIRGELGQIAGRWTEWRRVDGGKKLVQEVPEVKEWLNELKGDTKRKAESWIGRLNTLRSDGDKKKRELLKALILSFESYRRKEQLDFLEKLTDESIEPILRVFDEIDDLQLSYYGQIVNLRLGVIRALKNKLNSDDKEQAIRDHIFDHLWLLDPSWERVRGSEESEATIAKFLKDSSANLTDEERKGRIDIGYRKASGRHVIVELKRSTATTRVDTLSSQIRKYRSGAKKLLATTKYSDWPLDIICLLGKPPQEWSEDKQGVIDSLKAVDARILFYDNLLENAEESYRDYLEKHKEIDRLWKVFKGIDDFDSEWEN